MELSQLRYFVQVAKLESISRAAQVLHVSQPALSKSIAKLEADLDTSLFDRVGKRLYLNDRGRLFLKGVERSLQGLSETTATIRGRGLTVGGTVNVGVFGPQAEPLECAARFMQLNPHVRLTFDARHQSSTTRVVREFDMVFYSEGPAFEGLYGVPYTRRRLMVCVPESHPLADAESADLCQFKDDPFIFMNTTAGVYEQSYQLCIENGFSPWVRAVTSSGAAQIKFIQDGLGVGLVDTTRLNAGRRGTALVPLRGEALEQVQCFACRSPAMLGEAGRAFMDFVISYFSVVRDHALACFERN